MIINSEISNRIFRGVERTKKISKLAFDANDFRNWCHTLNVIAAQPHDVELLNRYSLDKYKVVKPLSDLVIPRKISFATGTKWEDVRAKDYVEYESELDKYGMKDAETLVPLEFNEISAAILGAYRKDYDSNVQPITELNGEVAAATYLDKFAVINYKKSEFANNVVASLTQAFIPVMVESTDNLMLSKYYNQEFDVNLDSWIQDAIDSLRNLNN